tara:strand:+ start:100 stop:213 length:114 start_codon:yes stop_codon:yes gene_type:complete
MLLKLLAKTSKNKPEARSILKELILYALETSIPNNPY